MCVGVRVYVSVSVCAVCACGVPSQSPDQYLLEGGMDILETQSETDV